MPFCHTDDDDSLNGIGAGPAETAQPAIIADVFFLHDRGKFNTLYFAVYFGSLAVRSTSLEVMIITEPS